MLIEQFPGHSSRCDHTSCLIHLELQRVGVSSGLVRVKVLSSQGLAQQTLGSKCLFPVM